MARTDFRFSFPKRVRFAEIDAQGVVFNSRYLEYFDIAATEYWRAVGMFSLPEPVHFHVARAVVNYRSPVLLDELIDLHVRCARIGTSSMMFAFELHGAANSNNGDDLRASGEQVSVHVAAVRGRPAAVPGHNIDMFEKYEGRILRQEKPV
jgi:acyl-CoA thioester hydrolase